MSVISVRELPNRTAEVDEKSGRKYTRVFRVRTDDMADGPIVAFAPGIPRRGDVYVDSNGNYDYWARCISGSVSPVGENPTTWEVTVHYSSQSPDASLRHEYAGNKLGVPGAGETKPGERSEDPLLRPPEVSWSHEDFRRSILTGDFINSATGEVDIEDAVIANSAGDPFDPPPEVDDAHLILTVVRNQPFYDPLLAFDYKNAVNSDTFLGFPPGVAKVREFTGQSAFENNKAFAKVTLRFEFRMEGWDLRLLDAGYAGYWMADKTVKATFVDRFAHPFASISPMDGKGNRLPDGSTDFVYLRWRVNRYMPFAIFGLG